MAELVAIAAVARNGVIGAGNDIPWRIPQDLARFKSVTMGQLLIMGRRTFDSIGRPLPGRQTIVVTRDPAWSRDGVSVAHSVVEAISAAGRMAPGRPVFVVGGGEIYRAAWELTDRLDITEVDVDAAGDVSFPRIDPAVWARTGYEPHDGFAFSSYQRRSTVR